MFPFYQHQHVIYLKMKPVWWPSACSGCVDFAGWNMQSLIQMLTVQTLAFRCGQQNKASSIINKDFEKCWNMTHVSSQTREVKVRRREHCEHQWFAEFYGGEQQLLQVRLCSVTMVTVRQLEAFNLKGAEWSVCVNTWRWWRLFQRVPVEMQTETELLHTEHPGGTNCDSVDVHHSSRVWTGHMFLSTVRDAAAELIDTEHWRHFIFTLFVSSGQ